eukprot:scaffold77029_cov32-Tisochrysis_lutea.AAC.2
MAGWQQTGLAADKHGNPSFTDQLVHARSNHMHDLRSRAEQNRLHEIESYMQTVTQNGVARNLGQKQILKPHTWMMSRNMEVAYGFATFSSTMHSTMFCRIFD